MTVILSRRAVLTLALTVAGVALAACGKKGTPLPPPGETSDFPRQYPNPSKYPYPEYGSGATQQKPPPEQQNPPSDIYNSTPSGTTNPGMNYQ